MTGVGIGSDALPWSRLDPFHITGLTPRDPFVQGSPSPALESSGAVTPGAMSMASPQPWHPDSPMFWLGALLLVTFGFIAGATELRVGPFRASVSAERRGAPERLG